jgi:hypothetical protein
MSWMTVPRRPPVLILRLLLMMAQDVEVAPSFQPLVGLAANFLRSHESQVADPMIEAGNLL